MGAIEDAFDETLKNLRKIRASGESLQGNFYFVCNSASTVAGLAVTLTLRDRKGAKALATGKEMRRELKGSKFCRGIVRMVSSKLMFVIYSGTASKTHMRNGCRKSLCEQPGFRFIQKARFLMKNEDVAVEVAAANREEAAAPKIANEDPEDLAELDLSKMTAKEQTEIRALIRDENRLGDLSSQLEGFLSDQETEIERAEQITDQLKSISKLLRSGRPSAEIAEQQRILADLMATGGAPIPTSGTISPQIFHLLEMSMEQFESETVSAKQMERLERTYHSVHGQLTHGIERVRAMFPTGNRDADRLVMQLHTGLVEMHGKLMSGPNPPNYQAGINWGYDLAQKHQRKFEMLRQEFDEIRSGEEVTEKARLLDLRDQLRLESELRMLRQLIAQIETDLGTAVHTTSGNYRLVENAKRMADGVEAKLKETPPPFDQITEMLYSGERSILRVRDAFDKRMKLAERDPNTSTLMAKHKRLLTRIEGMDRISPLDKKTMTITLQISRDYILTVRNEREAQEQAEILQEFERQLEERWDRTLESASRCRQVVDTVHVMLGHLMDLDPPSELTAFQSRLQNIESSLVPGEGGGFSVDEGTLSTQCAQLNREIRIRIRDARSEKEAWDACEAEIPIMRTLIEAHTERTDIDFATSPAKNDLELLTILSSVRQQAIGFRVAAERFNHLRQKVVANSKAVERFLNLGETREEWITSVSLINEEIGDAVAALRTQAGRIDAPILDALTAEFVTRQETLLNNWAASLRSTTLNAELVEATLKDMRALIADIETAKNDEIEDRLSAARRNVAASNLEKTITESQELLRRVEGFEAEELGRFEELLTEATQLSRDADANLMVQLVADLQRRVLLPLRNQETGRAALLAKTQRQVRAKRDVVFRKFQDYIAEIASHDSSTAFYQFFGYQTKAEYKRYQDVLKLELDELSYLAQEGRHIDSLLETEKQLNSLLAEIRNASMGLRDRDRFGHRAKASLSVLKHKIEPVIKYLGEEGAHKERFPAKTQKLREEYQELYNRLGEEILSDSEKTFSAYQIRFGNLRSEALNANRQLIRLNRKIQSTRDLIERERRIRFSPFPNVYDSLISRLQSAETLAPLEDKLAEAKEIVDDVIADFRKTDDGLALSKMGSELDSLAAIERRNKVEWDAELESFNRELFQPYRAEVAAKLTATGKFRAFFSQPEKIAEIEKLQTEAIRTAEKGSYEMARFQLASARNRMEFHMRFPEGQNAAVLSDLRSGKGKWREAVWKYRMEIETIVSHLETHLTGARAGRVFSAVQAAAEELKNILPLDAFDSLIDDLVGADESTPQRFSCREAALARLREMHQRLNDPRLRIFCKHPFPFNQFQGHFHVGKFLTDLEKTFLLSAT